ncbi:MAG: Bifunctional protein GlmU [Firmicutes bacterium ADurb.Bin300]|nr:MAG: Bifunctional protein GlmU [Firmicutes bacterium ADurb.Bin300]
MSKTCAIILAAGEGVRMKSNLPKALLQVLFKPMLTWVTDAVKKNSVSDICIVAGYKADKISEYIKDEWEIAIQNERLGTGHAVKCALDFLHRHKESQVLIVSGDVPFVDSDTINESLNTHLLQHNSVTVISAVLCDPLGYGRIIRDDNNCIEKIVEEKDATASEKEIQEINSGAYWFSAAALIDSLSKLTNDNAKGEYYLTDTIEIIKKAGKKVGVHVAKGEEIALGANTRIQLNKLNEIARKKELERQMLQGVDIPCTDGVIISANSKIGNDTTILPNTIIKDNVTIGQFCTIGPNTVLENCTIENGTSLSNTVVKDSHIGNNVSVGPFAHIRPDCDIRDNIKIGNFVEIKNSIVDDGSKLPHLIYVGDSDVGKKVNFGCGCVTVNYTGKYKYRTVVKDGAFIGCNTNLVAPVTVGEKAYIAAGSTITRDIPEYSLAIARSQQIVKENWVKEKDPYK